MYIIDVVTKTAVAKGTPEIVKETVATALVEGNNILGNVLERTEFVFHKNQPYLIY